MKISDILKSQIYSAFRHTIFKDRDQKTILATLSGKFKGSDTITILPPIQEIKVETIDVVHDRITFTYDDYKFDVIITWKPTKTSFVFMDIE